MKYKPNKYTGRSLMHKGGKHRKKYNYGGKASTSSQPSNKMHTCKPN